jgi:hypothetical protein
MSLSAQTSGVLEQENGRWLNLKRSVARTLHPNNSLSNAWVFISEPRSYPFSRVDRRQSCLALCCRFHGQTCKISHPPHRVPTDPAESPHFTSTLPPTSPPHRPRSGFSFILLSYSARDIFERALRSSCRSLSSFITCNAGLDPCLTFPFTEAHSFRFVISQSVRQCRHCCIIYFTNRIDIVDLTLLLSAQ